MGIIFLFALLFSASFTCAEIGYVNEQKYVYKTDKWKMKIRLRKFVIYCFTDSQFTSFYNDKKKY